MAFGVLAVRVMALGVTAVWVAAFGMAVVVVLLCGKGRSGKNHQQRNGDDKLLHEKNVPRERRWR